MQREEHKEEYVKTIANTDCLECWVWHKQPKTKKNRLEGGIECQANEIEFIW